MSTPAADSILRCKHETFAAEVDVIRLVDEHDADLVTGYTADVRVRCADCGEPFRWTGVKAGWLPSQPMCSVDEFELHAPLRPASADPDFGQGIPGYSVRAY